MDIHGAGMPTINPGIQVIPSASAMPLTGSPSVAESIVTGAVVAGTTPGRMQELIKLINTFTPAEIMTALLMANTTYQQSELPASVTAAAIQMQIASLDSPVGTSTFANASSAGTSLAASGAEFSIRG